MARPAAPREEIVDRLAEVFRHHGYEGASLKLLSDATGLGRSSLYHYFPNGKQDMASAVLERSDDWGLERLTPIMESDATPEEKIRRFANELDAFYRGGQQACLLELFVIGDAQALFGERVAARLTRIKRLFAAIACEAGLHPDEAARRSEEVLIGLHGALVVSRGLGDSGPFQRFLTALPHRLMGT